MRNTSIWKRLLGLKGVVVESVVIEDREAHRVVKAAENESLSALYVIALYRGLRRAELLGLRWEEVQLEVDPGRYPYLEVVHTLQRVGGELRFVPPKTRTSRRTIPLPPVCVGALRGHAARQARQRAEAGRKWREHGLVFPSQIGTPMEPDNLRRSWDGSKPPLASRCDSTIFDTRASRCSWSSASHHTSSGRSPGTPRWTSR